MPKLLLFNPENDSALASGNAQYTPNKGALAIRRAGALLPLWWADEGDAVLVDDQTQVEKGLRLKERFGLSGDIVTTPPSALPPSPWGWSRYTRRDLFKRGVDPSLLPSDAQLERLRDLSHRRTSIEVCRHIGIPDNLLPVEAFSLNDVLEALDRFGGRCVVKLPWSSSGRGVIYSAAVPRPTFETYAAGMIRRQGSVTVEPHFDRLSDFAMLFFADQREFQYRGLSAFSTDSHGFYTGNIVDSQQSIANRIGFDLTNWIAPLTGALQEIAPDYSGWIGVDMLSYSDSDGSIAIAPCIEVNFRLTMGVVALEIARRHPRLLPSTLHNFRLESIV